MLMNFLLALQIASADVNFRIILPELIVTLAGVVVMMVDAFAPARQRWLSGGVSLAGLLAAMLACLVLWNDADATATLNQAFNGMIVLDRMRLSFTIVFLIVSALTVLISMIWVEREDLPAGEFHSLLLFATVGMMLMASGGDLVIIFLGLETLSIATYVMAGFRRTDVRSNESALKYFILGSFSSAFLLYGIALTYGATATLTEGGTTNIALIADRIGANTLIYPQLLFAGAAMMIVGFGFKIATAPFHVWTPDVYEGAPTPVTAFMAAGPKAAGFAAFMRVFIFGFPLVIGSTVSEQSHTAWISALTVLAVLTMTIGNTAALVQSNVKRMLAYSSIAHAGYALVGFIAAGAITDITRQQDAIAGVVFYMLTYAVMNIGAFAVVLMIARTNDRRTEIEDYTGIGFKAPALAFSLSIFLLSLLGVPLTAGFVGKVVVFRSAFDSSIPANLKNAMLALVIIGVINTAISAYYYLGLIVAMFFRERTSEWTAPRVPASVTLTLVLTIVGVLYLGIFPGKVIDAFRRNTINVTRAEIR